MNSFHKHLNLKVLLPIESIKRKTIFSITHEGNCTLLTGRRNRLPEAFQELLHLEVVILLEPEGHMKTKM